MLVVVLILNHRLDLTQAPGKIGTRRCAVIASAVGVTTVVKVDLSEVLALIPQMPVNGVLYTSTIGARLGAKNAPTCLTRRLLVTQALTL
ncbi:hypothetical protein D3C81_764050 [compost metagenome]